MRAFYFLFCIATLVPSSRGDDGWEGQILSLLWENDAVTRTDRHYTQGARISYLSRDEALPNWLGSFSSYVPTLGFDVEARKFGIAAAQEIYTPDDLRSSAVVANDRPYAGWLYATATLQRRGRMQQDVPVMENLSIDLGVIGPESFAEETQDVTHHTIANGWHNQLKTEPGLNLRYDRSWLLTTRTTESPWAADLIPFCRASAGNVLTFFGIGSTVRFGYIVPNEFAVSLQNRPSRFGAYLFGTVQGRHVLRNIFLDGSTFRNSPSVEKRALVGEGRAGFTLVIKQVELTAAFTLLTQEFKGQAGTDGYGTVVFTIKF